MSVTNHRASARERRCAPPERRPDTAAAKLTDELKKLRSDMMRLDNAVEQTDCEETWEEVLNAVGLVCTSTEGLMDRVHAMWLAAYEDGDDDA